MKITWLGHAGLLVESGADVILCDPWLSPYGAYAAAWFPMPPNDRIDPASLERATYLYISHWHRDHFDEWFLRGRSDAFKRRVTVLLPDFRYPKLREWIEACGYQNIVLLNGEMETPSGTRFYIQLDENPLYADSALTIAGEGTVFSNANDCKLASWQELEIVERFGKVDILAAQFSGATFHPTCYEYSDDRKREISADRREAKFQRILNSMERLGATVYVPSAGPACFLDHDLFHLNLNGATVFATTDDFRRWLTTRGGSEQLGWKFCELEVGVQQDAPCLSEASRKRPVSMDLEDLTLLAARKQDAVQQEVSRYAADQSDLVRRAKEHFQQLLSNVPALARDANVTAKFVITGVGEFYMDTARGEIYDKHRPIVRNQRYEVELSPFWAAALFDGKMSWEDLILSFRFRISRSPDTYNEAFMAFLYLESAEERQDYLDHKARLAATKRERVRREVEGKIIEHDRYCPHNAEDLSTVPVVDGVLTCPRHFWRFGMETGEGLNNPCSLRVVVVEEAPLHHNGRAERTEI